MTSTSALRSEREIIGALLVSPEVMDDVGDLVHDVDFYLEKHRIIYGRIVALRAAGHPVDPSTVAGALGADLEAVGGLSYLSGIPILLVTAYGALVNIHRSGLKWDLPLRLMIFGLFGWAAGVVPAVIDGIIRVNLVMHNTQWVPGHFHFYLLLGLVPMALGCWGASDGCVRCGARPIC